MTSKIVSLSFHCSFRASERYYLFSGLYFSAFPKKLLQNTVVQKVKSLLDFTHLTHVKVIAVRSVISAAAGC